MGTLYFQTDGASDNSGCTDSASHSLTGTNATWEGGTTVTLDGTPDLSGLITSGATQSTIYLTNASNTNKKIFWITAFDDDANTVTVDIAPTGVSGSVWKIGGRNTVPQTVANPLRAGDTLYINDNYSATGVIITVRTAGDTTSGTVNFVGKAGAIRVLTTTDNSSCINGNSVASVKFTNLEFASQGASANCVGSLGARCYIYKCTVSDGGGDGIVTSSASRVIQTAISGCGDDGLNAGSNSCIVIGCDIHDNAGDGIDTSIAAGAVHIIRSILDSNTGRGAYFSGAPSASMLHIIMDNVFYANGNSGLEFSTGIHGPIILNNIFLDNGNAEGEYNIEFTTSDILGGTLGDYNDINSGGGLGGGATLNYTSGANDIATAPTFTNAAGRDFSLQAGSPCINTGLDTVGY